MCIGIPARVLHANGLRAECESRGGPCTVDLSLTGPVAPGTWVLTFLGAAREVIDETRARDIEAALTALEAIARGETSVDSYFADLADREPELPEHLREKVMR
ncbi:HypC/HybG/HupF family hydrogenase formation chaperone [Paraburkholderia adhaesiva]|uniref:HypC/HybG/HupF family hydrogenase formation chaperone n=1 Tax=Paraburkholderia adhaesiva TaxID=2883244 RepID=UPI001F1BE3DF|nr:HypC/HybG/HupF family hydrogenase formation chaperone [Paraburkholderia adhaesiva]